MTRAIFVGIVSFIAFQAFFLTISVYGSVSTGGGVEYFAWREYKPTGQPVLEENGYRYTFRLNWTQDRDHGTLFGYHGKLYAGIVTYHGETLDILPVSVTTDTSYAGFLNEGDFIFRYPLDFGGNLDLITGLGWDHWARSIKNPNADQVEDYDILFLKLGPTYTQIRDRGLWVGGGVKLPLYTFENAHLDALGFDQNPLLRPGRRLSFYMDIGCRINRGLEIVGYYDSYLFSESQRELVSVNGTPSKVTFQPESHMELFGIQAIYHFR